MPALPDELRAVVDRFDHVAIAVHDLRTIMPMVALLEGRFRKGGEIPEGGFRWAQFHLPEAGTVEYLEPLDPTDESNFLPKRGS